MKHLGSIHTKEAMKSYILAADLLPEHLWHMAFSVSEDLRLKTEEFRLRAGRPMALTVNGQMQLLKEVVVQQADIDAVLAKATRCSMHSFEQQLCQGFLTVQGGHRIGIGGILAEKGNGLIPREIHTLNIRIARQYFGIAQSAAAALFPNGQLCSALILAAPGIGKTTLLRDLCRILSQNHKVSVVDGRFELDGTGFDLGNCDLLQGGSKAACVEMLMRGMSPECIAVDEITAPEDGIAIAEAAHTGVRFLATAHGASIDDLQMRPLYKNLDAQRIFEKVLLLERTPVGRAYRIYERRIKDDKNTWTHSDHHFLLDDGIFDAT